MKKVKDLFKGILFGLIIILFITVFGWLFHQFVAWEFVPIEKLLTLDGFVGGWWRISLLIIIACGIVFVNEKD